MNCLVAIGDRAGNLALDRAFDGPLMLVQLRDGRYAVTAQSPGKTETGDLSLAQASTRHSLSTGKEDTTNNSHRWHGEIN